MIHDGLTFIYVMLAEPNIYIFIAEPGIVHELRTTRYAIRLLISAR